MASEEETVTENNPNINAITERPERPYRITVELPLFLTMLSLALMGTPISNIILYRTCFHSLNHTKQECQVFLAPVRGNDSQALEREVQKYTAFITMVKTILESVAPAILSLFLGVWSDRHGRKPLVVWPLFGLSIGLGMTVVYSTLDDLGPWWYIATCIPMSLAGGFTAIFTGAFCYVSDVSSTEKRSIRMTILEAAVSAGSVIGSITSSYLLRAVGNVYLLLISTTLVVIAYVFTSVFVKESLERAIQGGISSLLDLTLVKEMFSKCFEKRPNKGRAQILLLTIANSFSIFILYGLMGLDYLYVRQKLFWAVKEYTTYSAVSTTISFFGSFFGVMVMQKVFRISDLMFAIIAFLSASLDYFIRTFAIYSWHMYFGAAISLFKSLSAPLIRSLLTKILPPQDIAKIFALICAIEGICPLISPVLYNSLYAFTLSTFPGAIYVLSGCITCLCAVLLGFVLYYRRNSGTIEYDNLTNET